MIGATTSRRRISTRRSDPDGKGPPARGKIALTRMSGLAVYVPGRRTAPVTCTRKVRGRINVSDARSRG